VVIATRRDLIRLAARYAARRIEGQGAPSSSSAKLPAAALETASPPAVEVPNVEVAPPVLVVDERLGGAS